MTATSQQPDGPNNTMPHGCGPFALVVRFYLLPGTEAEFDELTRRTAAEIRTCEPGTLAYLCHTVEGEPQQRIFYELYQDQAAFDAHEQQPHIRRFLQAREEFLESFEVDFLPVFEGKPLDPDPGKDQKE